MRRFIRGLIFGIILGIGIAGGIFWFLRSGEEVVGGQLFGREEGVSRGAAENVLLYIHPRYKFSFEFPKELGVARYPEGNASETVVFQKPGEKLGFQIFITPYIGETITEERLRADVKGGTIEKPTEVIIGNNQRALVFFSNDPVAGRLREVWFIHDGFIYEVTAYAELDTWLADILKTWRFQE